jgi:hypothetical protein
MYTNPIYMDRVALAWSLADSVTKPRNGRDRMSRRRFRRIGSTGANPLRQFVRWLKLTRQSYSGRESLELC